MISVEISFLATLLVYGAACAYARPQLFSPLVIIPPVLILYSSGALMLAQATGFLTGFSYVDEAAAYSFVCTSLFIAGILIARPLGLANLASRSWVRAEYPRRSIVLAVLAIGIIASGVFIYLTTGSLLHFASNLNHRQETARGNTWPLFFVVGLELAYTLAYMRSLPASIVSGPPRRFNYTHIAVLVGCIGWVAIVGGRALSMQVLICAYIIKCFYCYHVQIQRTGSGRGSLPLRDMAIAAIAVFLVIFVYGFYRVGQGVGGHASDFLLTIVSEFSKHQKLVVYFLVNNFFDGWWVMLDAIEQTHRCQCLTWGAGLFGSVLKMAPGIWDPLSGELLRSSGNFFFSPGHTGERTVSVFAWEYIDFGFFGCFVFLALGILTQCVWTIAINLAASRLTNAAGAVYAGFLYSVVLTNLMFLIRSGPAAAFTFLFAGSFWACAYWVIEHARLRFFALEPRFPPDPASR